MKKPRALFLEISIASISLVMAMGQFAPCLEKNFPVRLLDLLIRDIAAFLLTFFAVSRILKIIELGKK